MSQTVPSLFVLLAAVWASAPLKAATFCATSADGLTADLAAAQADKGANHQIRIHAGVYPAPAGGWRFDAEQRGVTIEGGFDGPDCATQTLDASLTVLDGHHAVRPLTIDTTFVFQNTLPKIIVVRGLTFANGLGASVGGLKVSDAGPIADHFILIERNVFRDNVATVHEQDNSAGGLLAASDGTDGSSDAFVVVRNNLFAGNRAPDAAAALMYANTAIDFSNNTVVGNQPLDDTLASRTSVAAFTFSGITYSNNIFRSNNPEGLDATFDLRAGAASAGFHAANLIHNDLEKIDGAPATDEGNKNVDPQFVDAPGGDFHLARASTLIDAGFDAAHGGLAAQDIDGAPRLQGAHVDMGAYEADAETIFANGFD